MEDGQGLVFVGFLASVFSFIRFFVLLDSHTMDKQIFLLLSLLLTTASASSCVCTQHLRAVCFDPKPSHTWSLLSFTSFRAPGLLMTHFHSSRCDERAKRIVGAVVARVTISRSQSWLNRCLLNIFTSSAE
jgi:hypothetical protein